MKRRLNKVIVRNPLNPQEVCWIMNKIQITTDREEAAYLEIRKAKQMQRATYQPVANAGIAFRISESFMIIE